MFGIGGAFKRITGLSSATIIGGVLGGAGGALLGGSGLFDKVNGSGLSAAERKALADAQAQELDRKTRLAELQQRRTRVAMGSLGGARALMFGSFAGVDRSAPAAAALAAPQAAAATTPAAQIAPLPRRLDGADTIGALLMPAPRSRTRGLQ